MERIETGFFATYRATREWPQEIRVVNWNIARGTRLEQIVDFLAESKGDLILLQETDRNARRTGRLNVAAEIAQALKMNYAFGIEFQELGQGSRGSAAYHGQATLSVFPLGDMRVLRFRTQSTFWHPRWWVPRLAAFQRRLGGRMALLTHVSMGETTLAVYNLHLESRSGHVRRAQLAELLHDASRYGSEVPVILGGDFNFDLTENCTSSAIQRAHFRNPFDVQRASTVRSRSANGCSAIDWILTRGPLSPTAVAIHSSVSASDHYPLCSTLVLSQK